MDANAPKRRRLVLGDEDSLAEEGQPQLASKLCSVDSEDATYGGTAVRTVPPVKSQALAGSDLALSHYQDCERLSCKYGDSVLFALSPTYGRPSSTCY